MKYVLRWTKLALSMAALGLVLPRRSTAYLDPGTGSYMLQMLLALLVGGAFALKVFWKKLVAIFKRGQGAGSAPDPQQEQTTNEDQRHS
jgi:hypothetical protein